MCVCVCVCVLYNIYSMHIYAIYIHYVYISIHIYTNIHTNMSPTLGAVGVEAQAVMEREEAELAVRLPAIKIDTKGHETHMAICAGLFLLPLSLSLYIYVYVHTHTHTYTHTHTRTHTHTH